MLTKSMQECSVMLLEGTQECLLFVSHMSSRQSLGARLCQLQAKVDKINHAKGKPGSASCELFVGKSRSKELWVDISWARNQGLDRVDGQINPQKAAWSDRFEFQIVEFGQRKWLKVTRVDTNKGWGQELRVSMTSSSADTRLCQWKQTTMGANVDGRLCSQGVGGGATIGSSCGQNPQR